MTAEIPRISVVFSLCSPSSAFVAAKDVFRIILHDASFVII
jgi:hypothetical protein